VEGAQVVALVGFVMLAAVVSLAARRTGSVLQRTRVAEGFRGDVTDLAGRVERSLGDVSILIDALRRRDAEPDDVRPSLDAARDAVGRYATEARNLAGPRATAGHRQALVGELERAGRALELVDHGCQLAMVGRRHESGPEAETSIKRGYLNLIHARESIAEHAAAAILEAEGASPVRRLGRRSP
jgi:hypothetical protein